MRFTRWRRRRFFALLGESGNVQLAAELAGVGLGCIYRLRRVEPGFPELMAAAVAAADARLALRDAGSTSSPAPQDEREGRAYPEGRGEEEGLVIRRGIGGRLRVMAAGTRWWAARHDAIFLGHLRDTGNVTHSARAAGFTPKSAHNRRARMPSFARAWDAALVEAEGRLEGRLTAQVLTGGRAMEPGAYEPEDEPATFDPWLAIWLLKYWERKRRGRDSRSARDPA